MSEPLLLKKLDIGDDDDGSSSDKDNDIDDDFLTAGPTFARRSPPPPPPPSNRSSATTKGNKKRRSDAGPSRKRKIRELLKSIPTTDSHSTTIETYRNVSNSSNTEEETITSTSSRPVVAGRVSMVAAASPTTTEALERKRRRMEKAAQSAAEELSLDAVQDVTDFSRLGFVKDGKGGKNAVCRPAVIAVETSLTVQKIQSLQKQKTARRNVCVQYLGVGYKYANDYEYITKNQWKGLSGDGNGINEDDERRLNTHLKQISSHVDFVDNPLDLKTEECAIRECWKRVKKQQDDYEHQLTVSSSDDQKLPASATHNYAVPPNVSQDSHDEEEHANNSPNVRKGNTAVVKKSQSDDTSVSSSDDSCDNDDDEEVEASSNSGVSQKRLKQIHVGDVVEFTDPIGTAGDERFRIETTVEGIRSKGPRKGIIFNSWSAKSLTDLNHQIRLLKVVWKGKLVEVNASIMPLKRYSLRGGGIQDEGKMMQSTIDRQRAMFKETKKEIAAIADKWWEDEAAAGSSSSAVAVSAESTSLSRQTGDSDFDPVIHGSQSRKSLQKSQRDENGPQKTGHDGNEKEPNGDTLCNQTESWYSAVEAALEERVKIEKENIKLKRRYKPHLSIDSLGLLLKVCKHIQKKSLDEHVSVTALLGSMSDDYEIPDRNLDALILGDPDKKLREKQIDTYIESLASCLDA